MPSKNGSVASLRSSGQESQGSKGSLKREGSLIRGAPSKQIIQ